MYIDNPQPPVNYKRSWILTSQTHQIVMFCYFSLVLTFIIDYCILLILHDICFILSDATSCERCYSSFFCEGDGENHTCGRCENDTESCDRSPTEFSFGAQSECSSCLDGWVGIEVARITHFEINLMDRLFLQMEHTYNSKMFKRDSIT